MTIKEATEEETRQVKNITKVITNYFMTRGIEYNVGCCALISVLVNASINSDVSIDEVIDLLKIHWKGVEEHWQEKELDMSE